MTIITDLIFMAVDSWFSDHAFEGEEGILSFADEDEADAFIKEINSNFCDLRNFDNFKGGYCVADDTRQSLTVIMFLVEDDEICSCAKNYEIIY